MTGGELWGNGGGGYLPKCVFFMIDTMMQLPKTRLSFEDGMLMKRDARDGVVACFPLREIQKIEVEVRREYAMPLVMACGLMGLAWVCLHFIPVEGLAWAAAILCASFGLLCLLTLETRYITVHTENGVVSYLINDDYGDADGFIVSLRTAACASRGL